MFTERKLLRPLEAASLIHRGYDSNNATRSNTAMKNLVEVVKNEMFQNPEGPMLLFNQGAHIDISQYSDEKHESLEDSMRIDLPCVPMFLISSEGHRSTSTMMHIGALYTGKSGKAPIFSQSFNTDDATIRMSHGDSLIHYNIYLTRGQKITSISMGPYGSPEEEDLVGTVFLPFLPGLKRDDTYWNFVANMYEFELGEREEGKYNIVTYHPTIAGIEEVEFSSCQKYSGSELTIKATFAKPVPAKAFRAFEPRSGGHIKLDNTYVSHIEMGTQLNAEISKYESYHATNLLGHIVELGKLLQHERAIITKE